MNRVVLDMPGEYAFTTRIGVRVTDLNFAGHVGNDRLLGFLQEARARMLSAHGWTETDIDGTGLVLADAALRFRAEALSGDELEISIAVTDLSKRSCSLYYRVTRNDADKTPILDARTGVVFFDYATRKIAPVPDPFREWVSAEL